MLCFTHLENKQMVFICPNIKPHLNNDSGKYENIFKREISLETIKYIKIITQIREESLLWANKQEITTNTKSWPNLAPGAPDECCDMWHNQYCFCYMLTLDEIYIPDFHNFFRRKKCFFPRKSERWSEWSNSSRKDLNFSLLGGSGQKSWLLVRLLTSTWLVKTFKS